MFGPRNFALSLRSLKDDLVGRLFRNAALLLTGNGSAYALGLISLSLAARALGPGLLGTLVLINTYVFLVDALFNFQSWQALIKFGAELLESNRSEEFKSLVKFGLLLDLASALLSTLFAALGVGLIGPWLGWDGDARWMATLFSLTILFNLSGMPIAVLRLYGRFKLLAVQKFVAAAFKFFGVVVAFALGAGIWGFLMAWMGASVLGNLLLLWLGVQELRQKEIGDFLRSPVRGTAARHKGLWQFLWITNLHNSVRLGTTEADTLIVGVLLGSVATGIYKVVKQFSNVVGMITAPLYQAVYPELAKLWSGGKTEEFKTLILQSSALAGVGGALIWGIFAIFGSWVLNFSVGASYSSAYLPILIFVLALLISTISFPFQPALLAMGFPVSVFKILSISTAIYILFLIILTSSMNIVGASLAALAFHSTWFLLTFLYLVKSIRQNECL